ncbi:MAG TPA: nucleoside deaminase [Bacteroidota bacterium]|nr:nucleoside deaminase [Bacteroidota bacterium]
MELGFIFVVLCVAGGVLVYHTKFHRLKGRIVLTTEQRARLLELASLSLNSADVPVGAILLSRGEIIGEGYNTVLKNGKAGEHAEVNAISDAIGKIGMDGFAALDRSTLILISTFEPCLMCAGAFINYNVKNVFFMKEKDLSYTLKEELLLTRYWIRRRQIKESGEQEALFEKHPGYAAKKTR